MEEGGASGEPERAGLPARLDEVEEQVEGRYRRVAEQAAFIQEVDYAPEPPLEPIPVTTEYQNIDQTLIVTTEDKLRNNLRGQLDRREVRIRWVAATPLLLAFVAALVTSDFRAFGLAASKWEGLFAACAVLTAAYVVRHALGALRAPTREELLEDMIREIRGDRAPRRRESRWRFGKR